MCLQTVEFISAIFSSIGAILSELQPFLCFWACNLASARGLLEPTRDDLGVLASICDDLGILESTHDDSGLVLD